MQNPQEEKFRKIKLSNPAFQSRIANLPASLDFLALVGFQADSAGEVLVLPQEKVVPDNLNAAGVILSNAISNPMFGAL